MENKVRKKFVIYSTASVFVVVLVILSAINIFNANKFNSNTNSILNFISKNNGTLPKPNEKNIKDYIEENISPESAFSTRFFTVNLDINNNVVKVNTNDIYLVTYNEAIEYAKKSLNSKSNFMNVIESYKYKINKTENGFLIIFIDVSNELDIFYNLAKTSLFISLVLLIAVLFVSIILSKKAVKPILDSYKKQREFITNASHELKTPLAIISTNIDVIEMENGTSNWTESSHGQIKKLDGLINTMIKLSRLEETYEKIEKKVFNISNTLNATIKNFETIANTNEKTINATVVDNLEYNGNENLIEELFSTLIDNSIKYSTGKNIEIKLQREKKKITFCINNQTEIDEKIDSKQLMDRFTRNDKSRNSKTSGYGIGLSMAKTIVENHKGKIKIEVNKGIFKVYIEL